MYKITKNGVIRLIDNTFIPDDPSNRDWQEYQKWLAEGNSPEPMYTFQELKQLKLNQLQAEATSYILRYYPDVKQKSDIADKEYWGSWLVAQNPNYTTDSIYKSVYQSANNILSGTSDLATEISNYPQAEQKAWEQLIKIALRVAFVQKVKEEYWTLRGQIESATTESELEAIQIQFTTPPPGV